MACPPSKRQKVLNHGTAPGHDPFMDDDDFTQDDFDEIDVIASQAITGNPQASGARRTGSSSSSNSGEQSKPPSGGRRTFALSSDCQSAAYAKYRDISSAGEHPSKSSFDNGQHAGKAGQGCHSSLEAQHADLKKRLKEVEEEILMKNGEIRVLRDSLRLANQDKEQQRQSQLQQERERAQAQSEREKELNKKVQSLQSELHFKEAEMNEMRTKLQNSERGGKVGTPSAKNSPRITSSVAQLGEGGCSVSPGSRPFITKETFAAQLPVRASPRKDSGGDTRHKEINSNVEEKVPVSGFMTSEMHPGPVLLNLLLQHPLDPSSIGLCHLLCISPDALPGLLTQHGYPSIGSSSGSSASSSSTDPRLLPQHPSRFSQLQQLAMSGLSLLSLNQDPQKDPDPFTSTRCCPGAAHLLPLLEYHVSLFCQTLESVSSSAKSPLHGSSQSGSLASSAADTLGSQEDFALASLQALQHIVSQSPEVVQELLSREAQQPSGDVGAVSWSDAAAAVSAYQQGSSGSRGEMKGRRCPLHPLLKRLVQLADPGFSCNGIQKEAVVVSSLAALSVLAERGHEGQLCRLDLVLSSLTLTRCFSHEASPRTFSLALRLLILLANNDEVATKLCSHQYPCPFLKMFQYVTCREDKSLSVDLWSLLEVKVVRFLTQLFSQKVSMWAVFVDSSCQCTSGAHTRPAVAQAVAALEGGRVASGGAAALGRAGCAAAAGVPHAAALAPAQRLQLLGPPPGCPAHVRPGHPCSQRHLPQDTRSHQERRTGTG
ncbi:ATR-interacting protein isoform X2 [Denticeps clupeoides]|uniref:ATR-interacting protein isoform X2 n=1 Tax=Denticeps clupeoides TaxID=299321 RepID=UPI0010A4092D|nr:ATR-interacting protein isoform X2 [Denticeps clupeoides]